MQNYFLGADADPARSLDARKHRRIPFLAQGKVLLRPQPIVVTIRNLSFSGLRFECAARFDLGKPITLLVSGELDGRPFDETVEGRVMAIRRGAGEHAYGLQFTTLLSPERQPHLTALLSQHV